MFLFTVLFFTFGFQSDAYANLDHCKQLRDNAPQQFLGPLIKCLTDPDPEMTSVDPFGKIYGKPPPETGLIPATAINFMNATKTYFKPAATAMAIFLLSWFGLKLMTGDVQNVKGESFSLALKIAGVFFFLDEAPVIYDAALTIMNTLNAIIGSTIEKADGGIFCSKPDLWQSFDCLMAMMVAGAGVGLIAIVFLLLVTGGAGIMICLAFIYMVVTLFFIVARFAQVYIMSVISLSFMFVLGYLFVPLLLFKNTFHYFQKWLAICIAYMLMPLMMYAYMGLVLVALDTSIISSDHSVMNELFPKKQVETMNRVTMGDHPAASIKCPVNKFDPNSKNYFDTPDRNGAGCDLHAHVWASLGKECNPNNPQDTVNAGYIGNMTSDEEPGTQYRSHSCSSEAPVSTQTPSADISSLSKNQGEGKSGQQWLFDVLISILVATLLAYITHSLLGGIADLASDLVSQDTGVGKHAANAEVFGEAVVKFALEMARETAAAVTTGGASLSDTVRRKGGEAFQNIAEKIPGGRAKDEGGQGGGENPYG